MITKIKLKDLKETPWKNGGGATKELLRLPHPFDPKLFMFRLSIANIKASGPFSVFDGVDRILILLEGSGLLLKFDSKKETILNQTLVPILFRGEEVIKSELLTGDIRDFNVMTDRSLGKSEIKILNYVPEEKINFKGYPHRYYFHLEEETFWIIGQDQNVVLTFPADSTFIEITFYPHKNKDL